MDEEAWGDAPQGFLVAYWTEDSLKEGLNSPREWGYIHKEDSRCRILA